MLCIVVVVVVVIIVVVVLIVVVVVVLIVVVVVVVVLIVVVVVGSNDLWMTRWRQLFELFLEVSGQSLESISDRKKVAILSASLRLR